jgi:hypothetical protein
MAEKTKTLKAKMTFRVLCWMGTRLQFPRKGTDQHGLEQCTEPGAGLGLLRLQGARLGYPRGELLLERQRGKR